MEGGEFLFFLNRVIEPSGSGRRTRCKASRGRWVSRSGRLLCSAEEDNPNPSFQCESCLAELHKAYCPLATIFDEQSLWSHSSVENLTEFQSGDESTSSQGYCTWGQLAPLSTGVDRKSVV